MDLYRLTIDDCPRSFNKVGGSGHWRTWHEAKKLWQAELHAAALDAAGELHEWHERVDAIRSALHGHGMTHPGGSDAR